MDDDDAAVVPLRGKRTTTDGRRNPSKDQQLRRESEALALRIAGATFDEVAHALKLYGRSDAHKLVTRALSRHQAEQVDEMRLVEGARLDRMTRAVWAAAVQGDVEAVRAVIRISERRARLFGLDAPQRVNISDDVDEQIRQLSAQLADDGTTYTITQLDDTEQP